MKANLSRAVPAVFLILLALVACNQAAPPPPVPEIPFELFLKFFVTIQFVSIEFDCFLKLAMQYPQINIIPIPWLLRNKRASSFVGQKEAVHLPLVLGVQAKGV